MSSESDRQLVEAMAASAALADRNKLQPMLGVVVEVGTGDNEGMVRVRREPHEPTDAGRGFYFCVGAVPIVGAQVWCMSNFATGFVFGDFSGSGIETVSEDGTPETQRPEINFGAGFNVADNPGQERTDITLDSTGDEPPIGSMTGWAGTTDPAGGKWLICDGRAISSTTYPELSAILGTTWNTGGEAAGTFRIPDMRGRVAVGAGTGTGLTARAVAQKAGAESVALTTGQMPVHDHGGATGNDTHDHGAATGDNTHSHGGTTGSDTHSHTGDSTITWGNVGPNTALNAGGIHTVAVNVQASNVSTDPDPHSHTISGVTHNHTVTGDTHNHTIPSQGSGTGHDNMQPWIGMHQIIRVAA